MKTQLIAKLHSLTSCHCLNFHGLVSLVQLLYKWSNKLSMTVPYYNANPRFVVCNWKRSIVIDLVAVRCKCSPQSLMRWAWAETVKPEVASTDLILAILYHLLQLSGKAARVIQPEFVVLVPYVPHLNSKQVHRLPIFKNPAAQLFEIGKLNPWTEIPSVTFPHLIQARATPQCVQGILCL